MTVMQHDPDMPDEAEFAPVVQAEAAPVEGEKPPLSLPDVEAFALIIKEKRSAAINARAASGIEKIWQEDDDHYEGCDLYNQRYGATKGRTMNDSVAINTPKKPKGRSTAFANITRPYVDAGAARVADMLLPTDDRNWAIRPTPSPSLVDGKDDMRGVAGPDGQPMMRPTQPHEMAAQAAPVQAPGMLSKIGSAVRGMMGGAQPAAQGQQPMQVVTVADMAQQAIDKAKKSAERAQTEIDDWLVECRYHAEVRKVIETSARLGVGILKGPHPTKKKSRAVTRTPDGWKMTMEIKVDPASKEVSPWNFYPDENCGEYVKDGSHVLERDDITARGLKDLKGTPGYIDEMIDMCIAEGPIGAADGKRKLKDNEYVTDKDIFEIWYFQGTVSKKDMVAAGCECELDEAPCTVTMVNDRIIKIKMSPLDSGEFTYDVMVWQKKIGHWAGVGIGRQMRTCQKGLNGAVRAMQDNSALSSGPQVIVDRTKLDPADGVWSITPNKLWWTKPNEDGIFDANKAFIVVSIETRQAELLNMIQYWMKAAEDVTGLPMLLQGQQGKAPETVGGMTMLNNNANSVLRRIARTFDDRITEPHITRYYEWLLIYGPDEAKGDFQIDARGSSALVERDIQNQAMMQLLGISINPAYSLDPEKVMKEVLKGMRLDPKGFELDDEQKKQRANQPPPEDPRVTAAKIMAGSKDKALQFDAQQNDADRAIEKMKIEIDGQLGAAGLTQAQQDSLNDIKATLSGLAMKLKTQKELSMASLAQANDHNLAGHIADLHRHHNPQVTTPPTEPAGRATAGAAYAE